MHDRRAIAFVTDSKLTVSNVCRAAVLWQSRKTFIEIKVYIGDLG